MNANMNYIRSNVFDKLLRLDDQAQWIAYQTYIYEALDNFAKNNPEINNLSFEWIQNEIESNYQLGIEQNEYELEQMFNDWLGEEYE